MKNNDEPKVDDKSLQKAQQDEVRIAKQKIRLKNKQAEDTFGISFVSQFSTLPKKHYKPCYGLKLIVLALNNMDNKVLAYSGIAQHKSIIKQYRKAVVNRDEFLAGYQSTLEKLSPEERNNSESSLSELAFIPDLLEYLKHPLRSIVISACRAIDENNPVDKIRCVTANKRPVTVLTAKAYYAIYLDINRLIDTETEKTGQEKSVEDVLEDYKLHRQEFKEDETTINAYKQMSKAINFYAPRYKELFDEDPYNDLTHSKQL